MKATLIEITIYREIRVAWMKQRIKSVIGNIRKKITTSQNEKKKESKKTRIV